MSRSTTRRGLLTLAMLGACGLFVACEYGDMGPPNPAPNGVASGDVTSSSGGQAGGPPAAVAIRTVERRSPLGEAVGNLLVDGDFEYAAQLEGGSAQAGWYVFSNVGQLHLRTETGGLCRSGLRCGVLVPNVLLWGRGTAANGVGMVASVWSKPPAGRACAVLNVTLSRCNSPGFGITLAPKAVDPDGQGWCHYRGGVAASSSSMCMLIESTMQGQETALIDSAVLLPNDGSAPQRLMKALPPDRAARYRNVARRLRDLLPIGSAPATVPQIGDR